MLRVPPVKPPASPLGSLASFGQALPSVRLVAAEVGACCTGRPNGRAGRSEPGKQATRWLLPLAIARHGGVAAVWDRAWISSPCGRALHLRWAGNETSRWHSRPGVGALPRRCDRPGAIHYRARGRASTSGPDGIAGGSVAWTGDTGTGRASDCRRCSRAPWRRSDSGPLTRSRDRCPPSHGSGGPIRSGRCRLKARATTNTPRNTRTHT